MKKDAPQQVDFIVATKSMMDALRVAECLSAEELGCFAFNFQQFMNEMILEAQCRERANRYPMGRHDWGKEEKP